MPVTIMESSGCQWVFVSEHVGERVQRNTKIPGLPHHRRTTQLSDRVQFSTICVRRAFQSRCPNSSRAAGALRWVRGRATAALLNNRYVVLCRAFRSDSRQSTSSGFTQSLGCSALLLPWTTFHSFAIVFVCLCSRFYFLLFIFIF
jgi:hypothetical protein